MSRAFRYAPPVSERGPLLRPRLLERLRGRFERPVTAVLAAPGFGKTTLLAQAVHENTLVPLGEDHWLTCQAADTALSFLASDVFRVLTGKSQGERAAWDGPRSVIGAGVFTVRLPWSG